MFHDVFYKEIFYGQLNTKLGGLLKDQLWLDYLRDQLLNQLNDYVYWQSYEDLEEDLK